MLYFLAAPQNLIFEKIATVTFFLDFFLLLLSENTGKMYILNDINDY